MADWDIPNPRKISGRFEKLPINRTFLTYTSTRVIETEKSNFPYRELNNSDTINGKFYFILNQARRENAFFYWKFYTFKHLYEVRKFFRRWNYKGVWKPKLLLCNRSLKVDIWFSAGLSLRLNGKRAGGVRITEGTRKLHDQTRDHFIWSCMWLTCV